ncbi:MAG: CoA activase [bacterium]|nr:CoA activase [bacterium]
MENSVPSLGIDIGSVAVKLVLVEKGEVTRTVYRRFGEGPFETLIEILGESFSDLTEKSVHLGMTGIGGKTLQSILGGKQFGEIAALAAGNFRLLPQVRTVIEMGGEDSKLLILDPDTQTVRDFAMNAQCAAGTGSFLDQQASRLKISIEGEFGALALKSKHPPRIAGRCSVFAKSDMIHLQQIATPDYDIVAGLCFAVARNFKSAIARGKRFDRPIAFEGGVAANPGMIRAFTEILDLAPGELIVPDRFNVMSALGAAYLAATTRISEVLFRPDRIPAYLAYREQVSSGREALTFEFPDSKYYAVTNAPRVPLESTIEVFLGIDIGSLSTNVVLIDKDHRVIARRYLMTEGRPIEAVRNGLREIAKEVGDHVTVRAVGTTGSGRYLIADYVGADIVRNEITAQATAAVAIDPTVDTIFEIGGQDSKYISLRDKAVVDFEMNKACAAGTGSFLQEQAERLNINIEREFGERALASHCPVGCGERCTVFMESDLVAHQRSGTSKDDLIAGLAYSIASNYLTKVVNDRRIGENIFFQGGVAWNKGVVAAFENLTGKRVTVPPHHDVTGATGAAILAIECTVDSAFQTRFKGFEICNREYQLSSFPCEDCSNQCEIRKVEIDGEAPLYYGSRCEKYEVAVADKRKLPPDLFNLRQKLLLKRYVDFPKRPVSRGRVGIPRALHMFDYYPFWRTFFESLGFEVVNSDKSDQSIVEQSLELFSAETCYPIKMVYGHVANLMGKKVDWIFLPSIIKVADEHQEHDDGSYICPYVQSIGSALSARFDFDHTGTQFLHPPMQFSHDARRLCRDLSATAESLGITDRELKRAVELALKAFQEFRRQITEEGRRILASISPDEKVMVVISRPYNGFDQRLSLNIPEKIRDLGYRVIPMDFLPLEESQLIMDDMYWRYGRRILRAAEYIRTQPNLFAIYLSSFGCGPDSFILHFFRKQMAGKPYLQLEIDEHSADAGMVTRCEAFIDSLRFHQYEPPVTSFTLSSENFKPFERTIYIPNMCDHAFVMKAAFRRFGLHAEVLDEPDQVTLECGKKFTSGKECFPCIITTGEIVKKVREKGFDRSKAVFMMPGATGPCRFGLYRQLHRIVLDDLGFHDIPLYSPNSRNGYSDFGLEKTDFRQVAWQGMVHVDCLQKMLHATRPYEMNPGEAERLYYTKLAELQKAIIDNQPLDKLAAEAAGAFARLARRPEKLPVVGLVGEIYLRNNRFSNNHLISKLESLGLEVRLATFTEWPLYTGWTYKRDAWRRRSLRDTIHGKLQYLVQENQEHRIVRHFSRVFPIIEDQSVDSVLKRASRYLSVDFKGEAILSIGKAMEMVESGASGIINAMPFNCMPGTVVSSLSRTVAEDLGKVPWLNISYEGLRDSGEETRLEAFAEQVRSFSVGLSVPEVRPVK